MYDIWKDIRAKRKNHIPIRKESIAVPHKKVIKVQDYSFNVTINEVTPSLHSIWIFPLWLFTIVLAMESPRP